MRSCIVLLLCVAAASCATRSNERRYPLQGQVLAVEPARRQITLKHEEIKGFMPAMTMPYDVQDAKALDGLAPGDLINGAYVTAIRRVGSAPLEKPAAEAVPSASSGFELLKPGEAVPNARFVDQDGRHRRFSDFKGSPVAITFIYTRCPLPTFCPLMDRHFVSLQKSLAAEPRLNRVHLVTVSFDPVTDTPPVLKAHARRLEADLKRWTFLTGDRDEIDQFAGRFGVSVTRALNDPRDVTHNLRTGIVDANGRVVKVYSGNEWSPDQLLEDLKTVAAS
jgi:protein SCO1/2